MLQEQRRGAPSRLHVASPQVLRFVQHVGTLAELNQAPHSERHVVLAMRGALRVLIMLCGGPGALLLLLIIHRSRSLASVPLGSMPT